MLPRMRWALVLWIVAAAVLGACGGAPVPTDGPTQAPTSGVRKATAVDDCAEQPGKKAPEPLRKRYEGVAAKARCQREVFTIMGGLTHFLGVKCAHCHEEPDYAKMTHNKHVANWMARELIPSLEKKNGGGEVWCNDCHVVDGKGTAKILKAPRDQKWTIEWMTAHLSESFDAADGKPLRCKACHGANLGDPSFRRKIILTDHLPVPADQRKRPAPAGEAPAPAATQPPPADAGAADAATD